jgi:hypothetical protein
MYSNMTKTKTVTGTVTVGKQEFNKIISWGVVQTIKVFKFVSIHKYGNPVTSRDSNLQNLQCIAIFFLYQVVSDL